MVLRIFALFTPLLLCLGILCGCNKSPSNPMNEDIFWEIIEKSMGARGEEEHSSRLEEQLKELTPPQILDFYDLYRSFHQQAEIGDLWAAGMLLNGGHGSDDGFYYFRDWLIAQGRTVYEYALSNPDSLASVPLEVTADGPSAEWESYGYAAFDAYEALTKQNMHDAMRGRENIDMAAYPYKGAAFDWQDYTNEVLAEKLPKLWEKYGRFKRRSDEKFSQRVSQPNPNAVSNTHVAGLGVISVGDRLLHRKYGVGTIKSLTRYPNIVLAVVAFSDYEGPIIIDGHSGLWNLVQ
jgi:hypothetical protein